MKVAHVIGSLSQDHGGPSTAVVGMCRALASLGVHVEIVTTDEGQSPPVETHGVICHTFPVHAPHGYAASWLMARWLQRNLKRFDLVHIHSLYLFHTFVASRICLRAGIPYVVRPHGALNAYHFTSRRVRKRVYERLFEIKTLRRASGVHFASSRESEEACISGLRAFVVALGATLPDEGWRTPASLSEPYRVLYLGRLAAKKHPEVAIQVVARLRHRGFAAELDLVGPDADFTRAQLVDEAVHWGIERFVRVPGRVAGEQKRRLLQQAHLMVLPSEDENFGLAVIEALAAGVPVIVTPGVATSACIKRYGAGVVCDLDPESFAAACAEMLGSASKWLDCSHQARRLASERYTWERCARELEREYRRILRVEARQ